MKLFKFFMLTALVAGLSVSCDPSNVQIGSCTAGLTAEPGSQKIAKDGTAAVTFTFDFREPNGRALDLSKYTATLSIEATGGSVNPTSATTDAKGTVTVVFTTPDPQNFTGGTVKGIIKQVHENAKDGLFQQGDLATATAQILPLDAVVPPVVEEPIRQAEKLKDNTYSVQKKGGEVYVYDLPKEYSQWYEGASWMDGTKTCIHVECMDEDQEGMTQG